jgi:hypothetical protein
MDPVIMTNLIVASIGTLGFGFVTILTAFVVLGVGYMVFSFGWSLITGRTGMFTRMLSSVDRLVYKPYKGYNRLRSRKWNMEHTA